MRAALTVAGLLSPVPARARLAGWSLLEREEALALVPDLPGPVTGAAVWHEGRMYSAERLVLAVVARAVAAGASAANHTAVTGLLRSGDGSVVGVRARDTIGGTEDDLRARRTVLATGAACGHLARALLGGGRDAGAPNAGGGHSLAVNVVLGDLGYRTAFAIRSRQRGGGDRQLVFVPWRGRTLLGTGHYEYAGDPAGFDPARVDPAPLLEEANAAWDGPRVREEDVALVHAGLLPLDPSGARAPDRLLREPEVRDHGADGAPGLLSVTSVRFSYARVLARRTVAAVASSLARPATTGAPADAAAWPRGNWPGRSGSRHTERAPAARPGDALDAARADPLRAAPDLPEDVLEHHVRCYGADAAVTIRGMRSVPGWDRRVLPDEPVLFGQFVHGVRAEMARTTADLVWRRTEIGPRLLSCDAAEALAREALAIGPGSRGEVGDGGDGRADGRG
jgi:glycerol-3-phosphate dehydrogenase